VSHLKKEFIKTKNIKEALVKYASKNLIPHSECDFILNKIDTLIKSNASGEFEHFSKDSIKQFLDKQKVINEHIEFTQIYTLALMQKSENRITLEYSIDFGNHETHPSLILSPNSTIPYKLFKPVELLQALYVEINKIKAYNGILLQLFDTSMIKTLKLFVKYLYAGKFVKKVKIPLFDGIEPVILREGKLIYWFKEKEHEGLIIEVDENELLVEYKKPLYGKNGLNAHGQIINTDYAEHADDLQATIDPQSITIEEDNNSKRYISRIRGYIHYDENFLSVDNRIKLQEISRNTSIKDSDDEDNNIEVVVAQHDTTKDSIREGVKLSSETINVEGFVGANSILEASKLDIKGATHQDSKQYTKYAKINRHKGILRCHEANVGLLEGGVIHATKVTVESSLGGAIYAQDVTIGHVKSNLKVYASNSIKIRLVSGEDNIFKISYKDIPILKAKLNHLTEETEDLKYKLRQSKRFNQDNTKILQDEIETIRNEQQKIKESYKNATIAVEQPFKGLNHIIFTIDQEHELHYKTDAKEYNPFHLEIKDDVITLLPPSISITLS